MAKYIYLFIYIVLKKKFILYDYMVVYTKFGKKISTTDRTSYIQILEGRLLERI